MNISGNDSHDLGYGLKIEFWHKGIVTEACNGIVERLRKTNFPHIKEQIQPKNIPVTFRMYQLNFDDRKEQTYMEYWDKYENHFIETDV